MELQIDLIRNGLSVSGRSGKKPGLPDDGLLEESKAALRKKAAAQPQPHTQLVYAAGTLRARQTAGLLYPDIPAVILNKLQPMDLGAYQDMEYRDIAADKQFATWGAQPELGVLGEGESPYAFQARCVRTFRQIVAEMASKGIEQAAVITHRLVITTILQRFCIPRSYYKEWKIAHGEGYLLLFDTKQNTATIIGNL